MIPKALILPSLTALLLVNGMLFSDDETTEYNEAQLEDTDIPLFTEEHVSVGSREIDSAKRAKTQRRRIEQEDNKSSTETQQIMRKICSTFSKDFAPVMLRSCEYTFATYPFPSHCHWLTSLSDNSYSIELEDGSHWEVAPSDAYVLRSWRRNDSLIITPNYSWCCSYDYYITNKNNNTYVKANLYIGPLAFGSYSHWIVDLDYYGGHVYLENQMIWCVDPQDSHVMKNWAINDHVIIGLYDSWFSPYDHILINVNMDDHVRVKQY